MRRTRLLLPSVTLVLLACAPEAPNRSVPLVTFGNESTTCGTTTCDFFTSGDLADNDVVAVVASMEGSPVFVLNASFDNGSQSWSADFPSIPTPSNYTLKVTATDASGWTNTGYESKAF